MNYSHPKNTSRLNQAPIPVDHLHDQINSRYEKLALITSESDIAIVEHMEGVLIVSCDWLLWQRLVEQKKHVVYYEFGNLEWDGEDDLHETLFNRANDWLLDAIQPGEADFHGVCLGSLFGAEITMASINYHRISRSLATLIKKFQPKEVLCCDFRYEINHLTRDQRCQLVQDIADSANVAVTFFGGSGHEPASARENNAIYRMDGQSRTKALVGWLYASGLAIITRFRTSLRGNSNRVLLAVNSNLLGALLTELPSSDVVPVVLARSVPRRFKLLWRCFVYGAQLVNPKSGRLSFADIERVKEIQSTLKTAIAAPKGLEQKFFAEYVRSNILDTDALYESARFVLETEKLFDHEKPTRVVVDGVRSRRHFALIEIAARLGIPVDYTWHSPLTPQSLKTGPLGGDPRQQCRVARCLSWGSANDAWLQRVGGGNIQTVRVGSPLSSKYKRKRASMPKSIRPLKEQNVLILQYTYTVLDLAGLSAVMYSSFVESVQGLMQLGCKNIKYKLHPGPGRWTVEQFENVARHYNLDCEILKTEPFEQCLDWADVVIGPLLSGAFFETLAAGKPYHVMLLAPHSTVDLSYYDDYPVNTSVSELTAAITSNEAPEPTALLELVCSATSIPEPEKQYWQVLAKNVA